MSNSVETPGSSSNATNSLLSFSPPPDVLSGAEPTADKVLASPPSVNDASPPPLQLSPPLSTPPPTSNSPPPSPPPSSPPPSNSNSSPPPSPPLASNSSPLNSPPPTDSSPPSSSSPPPNSTPNSPPPASPVVGALDTEGEISDLSNGVKYGQSTAYDSGQYNQDIMKFRRIALGSDASSEFDTVSGDYTSRDVSRVPLTSSDYTSSESETRAMNRPRVEHQSSGGFL